ncbi:DUF2573 family protein [Peribacillus acanthi]|uniref:DUF2573 family protein n=1 Tax=Peribacillus acanthi TaxID=2171554 RepID=UPI000D3EDF83|nr:DUF2573 family protein [Peribacillus acanthi]
MKDSFKEQFDGLIEKYCELLLGDQNQDLQQKVVYWALYSHIAKQMPALAKHWNETYPEAKGELMEIIAEIKQLNEVKRQSSK